MTYYMYFSRISSRNIGLIPFYNFKNMPTWFSSQNATKWCV